MTGRSVHVLERKSQVLRLREWVAYELRAEMEDRGVTAKELSRLISEETEYSLDPRTIQNAMAGSCSLDTYEVLVAIFGWDFADRTIERVRQETRLASLEKEIVHERARIRHREAELERLRAAHKARDAAPGGVLRLVPEEDRPWIS
jgi:hypothetical protein